MFGYSVCNGTAVGIFVRMDVSAIIRKPNAMDDKQYGYTELYVDKTKYLSPGWIQIHKRRVHERRNESSS